MAVIVGVEHELANRISTRPRLSTRRTTRGNSCADDRRANQHVLFNLDVVPGMYPGGYCTLKLIHSNAYAVKVLHDVETNRHLHQDTRLAFADRRRRGDGEGTTPSPRRARSPRRP